MIAARGYLWMKAGILAGLVLVLAGCMQALNTEGASSQQPPPAWLRPSASPTDTLTVAEEVLSPALPPEREATLTLPVVEAAPEGQANGTVPTPEGEHLVAVFPSGSGEAGEEPQEASPEVATSTVVTPTRSPLLPSPSNLPEASAPLTPTPTLTPTPGVQIVLPTLPVLSNEQRWRAQQKDREVFEAYRTYTTSGSDLWWYDPVNQQHVVLGSFAGNFHAQSRFTLVGRGVAALEVPYQVNQSYGLQALSPALVQRIGEAGYGEWIEAYVLMGPEVQPVQPRS